MNSKKMLVLCGGRSAEHSISLVSAWNLLNTIKNDFDCLLIAISKDGKWFQQSIDLFLEQTPNPKTIGIPNTDSEVLIRFTAQDEKFYLLKENQYLPKIDVVFPLLHGTNGEDGNIQGVLNQLQLPYIGCDVLGSSICMDKDVAKRLMSEANISTSDFVTLFKSDGNFASYEEVSALLGKTLFIKPANLGSSVGINKVKSEEEFNHAIEEAFRYDTKVIVEEFIEGTEVECAVLGNDEIIVSLPGCYNHNDEFFDFDTKYIKNEAKMEIPASVLNDSQIEELTNLATKTYFALECKGLARVDIFVTKSGEFFVNEVNTMPGFTQNSMYPLLLKNCGITYLNLVNQLAELSIDRFNEKALIYQNE